MKFLELIDVNKTPLAIGDYVWIRKNHTTAFIKPGKVLSCNESFIMISVLKGIYNKYPNNIRKMTLEEEFLYKLEL